MRLLQTMMALAFLTVFFVGTVQAQGMGNMARRSQALTDSAVIELGLTGESEKAFRAIMQEQADSMRAIFEQYQGQRSPEMRDDVMALRESTSAKLAKVLTKEQMEDLNQFRQAMRGQMQQRPPPN